MINLTPHSIVLRTNEGDIIYPPSGIVARVSALPSEASVVEGIPVPVQPAPVWGEVEGLPEPQEGTLFLVSGLVLSRCVGRRDVFAPATGPKDGVIRCHEGRVAAVTRLNAAPLR